MGAPLTAIETNCAQMLRGLLDNSNSLSLERLCSITGLTEKTAEACVNRLCGEGVTKRGNGRVTITNISRALALATPEKVGATPPPKTSGIMDPPKVTPPGAGKFVVPPSIKPRVIEKPPSRWGQTKPFLYDWASIPVGQAIVVPIAEGFEFGQIKKLLTADSARFAKDGKSHFSVRTVVDDDGHDAVGVWRNEVKTAAAGKTTTKKK